jgi:hypothetical protein
MSEPELKSMRGFDRSKAKGHKCTGKCKWFGRKTNGFGTMDAEPAIDPSTGDHYTESYVSPYGG